MRRPLIDGDFDAGLQVEADRQEQLQTRRSFALALDQVDTDGGLPCFERAADGGAADHVRSRRLEAELAPIGIFDLSRDALAAWRELLAGRLLVRLRAAGWWRLLSIAWPQAAVQQQS